jgi:hypothetical protein
LSGIRHKRATPREADVRVPHNREKGMKTAKTLLAMAREADRRGDYVAAVSLASEASRMAGAELHGLHVLAWTHLTYGKADVALPLFREVLSIEPLHLQARLGLAHCLHETNDWRAAQIAYRLALPQGVDGPAGLPESVISTRRTWADIYVNGVNANTTLPFAYAAYSIASRLNNVANVVFDAGLLDIPYLYLRDVSLNQRPRRLDFLSRWLAHLCSFAPLTNHYCTTLENMTFTHLMDLEAPENAPHVMFIGEEGTHLYIHERIGHAFDFITDFLCFDDSDAHNALGHVLVVASRACSEGFAYWMQRNGVAFHNRRCPHRPLSADPAAAELDALPEGHPYRVGLECFQRIESQRGEAAALMAYFIAMDTRESLDHDHTVTDAKAHFRKPWNNPNCRLRLLADMELGAENADDAVGNAKAAQVLLEERFASLPQCELNGEFQ